MPSSSAGSRLTTSNVARRGRPPMPDGTDEGVPPVLHQLVQELDAEDLKLVTLARAARARIGSIEGAAVRDQDGRTYAASTVALPSLSLSALQAAVAAAVSAGAR